MNTFDAMRRSLLRSGAIGAAAAGLPALTHANPPPQPAASAPAAPKPAAPKPAPKQ